MKHLFFLLLLCGLSVASFAQTAAQDVVYLKNGAVIKGMIIEHQPGEKLEIDIGEGRIITLLEKEIHRVVQGGAAQVSDFSTVDVIYLTNGSVFKGKIRYETSHQLLLELSNGEQLTFHAKEIRDIFRDQRTDAVVERPTPDFKYYTLREPQLPKEKTYEFRERGWFNVVSFSLPNGFYLGEPQMGIGIHNLAGYQFSRLLGAGLGLGFDALNLRQGEYVASIYGEGRSYLTKTRTAPFVSFGAGYGFALPNRDNGIVKSQGGFRWHPALGIRLGAAKDVNVVLDVGYLFQSATYTREIDFLNRTEIREVDFRRFTLRFGAMF